MLLLGWQCWGQPIFDSSERLPSSMVIEQAAVMIPARVMSSRKRRCAHHGGQWSCLDNSVSSSIASLGLGRLPMDLRCPRAHAPTIGVEECGLGERISDSKETSPRYTGSLPSSVQAWKTFSIFLTSPLPHSVGHRGWLMLSIKYSAITVMDPGSSGWPPSPLYPE